MKSANAYHTSYIIARLAQSRHNAKTRCAHHDDYTQHASAWHISRGRPDFPLTLLRYSGLSPPPRYKRWALVASFSGYFTRHAALLSDYIVISQGKPASRDSASRMTPRSFMKNIASDTLNGQGHAHINRMRRLPPRGRVNAMPNCRTAACRQRC